MFSSYGYGGGGRKGDVGDGKWWHSRGREELSGPRLD